MNSQKLYSFIVLSFLLISTLSLDTTLTTDSSQNILTSLTSTQLLESQLSATSQSLLTTTSFVSQCANNQIVSPTKICIKPFYIEGCQTYQTALLCNKCSNGYTLNKDKKCQYIQAFIGTVTHIKGCIKQSEDSCDVCAQGFYKKQNKCVFGVMNCASYNKAGQCTQCQRDYSLILSQCRKNSLLGCRYQTQSHTCQQCYAPFTLNGEHCDIDQCRILNDYGCVSCECGYYLTPQRDCKAISPGCLRYQKGLCKDCLPHYKLKGGVCQIQGCLAYTGNYCKTCSDKYQLVDGQCHFKNCVDWLNDQCITCKSGYGLKSGVCVTAVVISCS